MRRPAHYSRDYIRDLRSGKLPESCANCGAPRGNRVVRRIEDHEAWSYDLTLHCKSPERWRKPVLVAIVRESSLCRSCDSAKRKEEAA